MKELEIAAQEELMHSYSSSTVIISTYGESARIEKCESFFFSQEAMINMFRKGAEWQAKQSPWISVEMAIPKDDSPGVVQVITVDGKEGEMAARRVMYNIYPYIKTGYVTHWRPIPALPKGGEG